MLNKTLIVDRVKDEFPEFYLEYGETFTEFLKVYYQWVENNSYTGPTKDVPSLLDIDETTSDFLKFFKKQYMADLPIELLGNQRYLQKHILDIYRSKGTDEGLRLLFRLLYNKEIDIYLPGSDVFRASAGKWILRKYFEVSEEDINKDLEGKEITGEYSGAKCIVESYEVKIHNGIRNHILWISNISGNFLENERVYDNISNLNSSPKIKGSVTGFKLNSSVPGFTTGEELLSVDDALLKFKVKKLQEGSLNGSLSPLVITEGLGYREGEIDYTYNKRGVPGSGAVIGSLLRDSDTTISFSDVPLADYANTPLNSADFGMPGSGAEDMSSNIEEALSFTDVNLKILYEAYSIEPGLLYDDTVDILAVDEDIARLEIQDDDGNFLGNNAVIEGYASFGTNLVETVQVVNSSFNYAFPSMVSLQTTDLKTVTGELVIGAVGIAEGYYGDNNSFLSNDKYLHDSLYYQEFSYDIKIDEKFSEYFDILRKVVHPAGKKAFGNSRIISETENISGIETIIEETS
jgi:hypothetical protein